MTETRAVMDGEPPVAKAPVIQADMSFLDHLEELRWRIVKGIAGIFFGVIIAGLFSDFFIDVVLLGPAKKEFFIYGVLGIDAVDLTFQNRNLPGQFFTFWGVLFSVGFVIGSPILFFSVVDVPRARLGGQGKTQCHRHRIFHHSHVCNRYPIRLLDFNTVRLTILRDIHHLGFCSK